MTDEIPLAFYGDDVTGSTDALEGLARNGVRAALFFDSPTTRDLNQFDDLDAIGVAGQSRTMTPEEMDAELPPMFESLAALDPSIVHYKVCSTFDSAPTVGSIGRAIDHGQRVFDSPFVPVSQGTRVPHERYVIFSNLFATQDGVTYRIDRHPTMRQHPVTPMTESNIRRHLSKQTDRPIGSITLPDLDRDEDAARALENATSDAEIVVFDSYEVGHIERTGRLLWERATTEQGPLFVVGSSGLEHHGLPHHWSTRGLIEDTESRLEPLPSVDQIAVISGSASPVTAAQIERATANGFEAVRIDTERLVDPETAAAARAEAIEAAMTAVENGRSVILYSVRGPNDDAIERTNRRFEQVDSFDDLGARLGHQLGKLFRTVLSSSGLERACIAGGDTSGFVAEELEFHALEAIATTAPSAPLCRVHSPDREINGIEVALKGGQTGSESYFELVRSGGSNE